MAGTPHTKAVAERIRGRPARRMRVPVAPMIRQLEQQAAARIMHLLTEYNEAVGAAAFSILEYIGKPEAPKFDDPHDIIERTFAGLRIVVARIFDPKRVGRLATDTALSIDSSNRALMRRQIRTVLKVDPLMTEPWLLAEVDRYTKENVSLITSVPKENLDDIEQMLYRDAQRKLTPKAMKQRIGDQFNIAEARAALIAHDQVGKFNGTITELRQTNLGVTEYIWRTSEDERVREDHYRLDTQKFSWSDPPITVTSGKRAGERNHPGRDIRCRCYAEPVLAKLLSG